LYPLCRLLGGASCVTCVTCVCVWLCVAVYVHVCVCLWLRVCVFGLSQGKAVFLAAGAVPLLFRWLVPPSARTGYEPQAMRSVVAVLLKLAEDGGTNQCARTLWLESMPHTP